MKGSGQAQRPAAIEKELVESMRIALATCSNLPDWEVDDRPLRAALEARGAEVLRPAWDDAAFDWDACRAVLIRTTWDYQERREAFLAWAARVSGLTLLFNPLDTVRWNTHKSYLRDLASKGVPTAPTVWLDAGDSVDLRAVLRERGWTRAFVKPAIGSTARETLRFAADDAGIAAATQHLERLLAHEDMLLQPYLEGVETEGELSVIRIDGEFTHAVRKVPVAGDYRVQDDFGASDMAIELDDELVAVARAAFAAVDTDTDLLYGRVDLLRDAEGHLNVTELELVEPSLFFRHEPRAAERLAAGLLRRVASLGRTRSPAS